MAVTAVTELIVAAPLERAFARFIDYPCWNRWLPPSFVPVSGPARALREADVIYVGVGPGGKLVGDATIVRLRPNQEICWSGGSRWSVIAEHAFFFSAAGEQTRVRSEETLTGLFAHGPLGYLLGKEATRVGKQILSAFDGYLRKPE
jgi:hypothetical protein